jgi:hypothetical protein
MSPKSRKNPRTKSAKPRKSKGSRRERIKQGSKNRCSYCLFEDDIVPAIFEVEHIMPRNKGGGNEDVNLCFSCPTCNRFKGTQTTAEDPVTKQIVPLFNPNTQIWSEHFEWSDDYIQVLGITPVGRATVIAMKLNNDEFIKVRPKFVKAGWHPPKEFLKNR